MLHISIDRAVIRQNLADGGRRPPICIETPGNDCAVYAREVFIPGPCRVVYRPESPDADDATSTAWIECDCDVVAS